ncbi:MAG: fibronectin type III domain-containing protein [Gammaproteobacteria bacterium]|nr:fibronectin type III domain-containing protein [Gammaproteobacteria bacterium]MBU1415774.1 fibronectin type III domain-containing protein [Gammaproteobacteria bacterium]
METFNAAWLPLACSFLIAACGGGSSGSGDSSLGDPSDPPATGTAILEWDAVVATNLAGYRIHYGTSPGSYQQVVSTGSSTSHTLNGLNSGTRYYFSVTAVDTSGAESGYSNEVSKDVP